MDQASVSVSEKKFDFSPFLQFGDTRDHEFKRREPVVHINNQKHEAARKKMLSFVQEVQWTKSKLSPGVSLAYLHHHKLTQLLIGLIKLEPRATKVNQNSGPVAHKFCVLTGEVDIKIDDTPLYKGNGVNSIIRIPIQTCYTIFNTQNDDTYLFFKSGPNV